MSDFAATLHTFRTRMPLSQSRLAARAEISHTYISRLEAGKRPPPKPEIVYRLAEALKLNEDETQELLCSAGYVGAASMVSDVDVLDLDALLRDPAIPPILLDHVRALVRSVIVATESVRVAS